MKISGTKVHIDDVVHAYRWILGREPESFATIEQHLHLEDRYDMRCAFLLSAEFQKEFEDVTSGRPAPQPLRPLCRDIDRFVFLHIPKTGGTTLHELLAAAIGGDRVSSERHNGLWRRSGAELASVQLFSGHYDRHCLSLVPGRRIRIVTILREPGRRLLSVYKFLRAHSPQLVARDNLALAGAARELRYGDFLRAALDINPAAVDNTYLRAFGAHLPTARWEQRAEPWAHERLEDLGQPVDQLLRRARNFLDEMAAVGVLENFDLSLRVIFAALGLQVPTTYSVKQRLADLVVQSPDLEPVENFEISDEDQRLTSELTRFDAQLYQHAEHILAKATFQESCVEGHTISHEGAGGTHDDPGRTD